MAIEAVAAVVGALAAVGGTVAGQVQSANAKKTADNTAALERFKQDQLLRQQADQEKIKKDTEARDLRRQSLAEKMAASGTNIKGGTVLTSPIGVPGAAATGNVGAKTAIGD